MKLKHFLLFAFISTMSFSACSDDNKEYEEEEAKEYILTAVYPLGTDLENNGDKIPFSWDPFEWNYQEGKLVSFRPKHAINVRSVDVVEHTQNILEANGKSVSGEETQVSLNTVKLENGLVKNYSQTSASSSSGHMYSFDHDYNYNAEGYLESVTGTTKSGYRTMDVEILLTWENGNITEMRRKEDERTTVYKYTYDNKAYIPMSDFTAYTPLFQYVPFPFTEFYTKMGKQNKNNIKEVNIKYPTETPYAVMKLTYETILNENGTIKQINHTGTYYPHFSVEDFKLMTFKGLRTLFEYTPKNKQQ